MAACPPRPPLSLSARRKQASLTAILADPLVEAAASPQLGRIKFLSLKNLGGLQAAAGPGRDAPGALGCYVAACELEAGDVVLWNRLGTLVGVVGGAAGLDVVAVWQGLAAG